MKYLMTVIALFLGGMIATAQEHLKTKTKETTVKEVMQGDSQLFKSKVVREKTQILRFKESSEGDYEKDLDLDGSPVKVVKTVWIDNDMDNRYDKMVRLSYANKYDEQVTFETTADGLVFKDSMGRMMMIKDYGYYVLNSGQDDEIFITVDSTNEPY